MLKYEPNVIKVLRVSKGMTPSQFAREIGVERQNIYHWERGTRPTIDAFVQIANAFGLKSLDIFFSNSDYRGETSKQG
jgi:DNA-binding XRE family transcriptional regulator